MSYGIKLNMAMTIDEDGQVEGGISIKDSEDLDISAEAEGSSISEVATALCNDAVDMVSFSRMSPTDKRIAELEKELKELKQQKENEKACDCGECQDCEDCEGTGDFISWEDELCRLLKNYF